MDENGTYSWPGGQNTRPKKKPDFKRAGRTVIAVIAALLVLARRHAMGYGRGSCNARVLAVFGSIYRLFQSPYSDAGTTDCQ